MEVLGWGVPWVVVSLTVPPDNFDAGTSKHSPAGFDTWQLFSVNILVGC